MGIITTKFHIALGIMAALPLAQSQVQTKEWTVGTPVTFMSATGTVDLSTQCPATLQDARSAADQWRPIQADLIAGAVLAGNPNPDGKLIEAFLLTNGLARAGDPDDRVTRIQINTTSPGQAKCWFWADDTSVLIADCDSTNPDESIQKFGVTFPDKSSKPTTSTIQLLALDQLQVFTGIPPDANTPITFDSGAQIRLCSYAADSGLPLVFPTTGGFLTDAQLSKLKATSRNQ